MTLQNQKLFSKSIIVPASLSGKINTFANCDVSEREIDIYNLALQCIDKQLVSENMDLSSFFVINVFFTCDGSIAFFEENPQNCGSQFHVALYRLQNLRKINNERITLFIYLEELVHYFWRISDETVVKYKVAEIMKYAVPEFNLEDLKEYKLNGL